MIAALRGSYVEYVLYCGEAEKYPLWFQKELYKCAYTDESRFTFWVFADERRPDYYEKQIIEDYSVIIRKPDGEIHITDYDVFSDLYTSFRYDAFTNSGIAAFNDDCIEYVECKAGVLSKTYPSWFYEYFTEAVNLPQGETIFFHDCHLTDDITQTGPFLEVTDDGQVTIDQRSVFMRNKYGEIRGLLYSRFIVWYDDNPKVLLRGGFK